MARYSKKIVKRICQLHEKDSYTISEVCADVGIAESTYYEWQATKPEFSEAIKKAKENFNSELLPEAKKSLKKLITGYSVTETKTVGSDTGEKNDKGKPIVKVKEHTKTEKHFQPNVAATIFALTNLDPDNWKNRQDNNTDLNANFKGSVPINAWIKKNGKPKKNEG